MNGLMNTLQFKTICLTMVFLTCILSQTLYENDYQQYTILNRESKEVSVQSLLDKTEALLKEKTFNFQKCIEMKDSYNDSLILNNQEQTPICVMSDIALGKPAKQSSTYYNDDSYTAKYAVDGKRSTDIVVGNCSHTADGDTNPWWMVDLQTVYYIKTVRILNRGMDAYGKDQSYRLNNVTVTVGVKESAVNTLCDFFPGPGTLAQLVVIDCPTLPQGRFVKISKTTEHLTLCEVDVFGATVL